jgi:hypothetical protein
MQQERTWIQCLHFKGRRWVAEHDDEDYEIDAKECFVTGIGKEGVGGANVFGFQPVRHGITRCPIANDYTQSVR